MGNKGLSAIAVLSFIIGASGLGFGIFSVVNFQLIEPKSYKLLWNKLITERVRDKIRLSQSNKLIFTSVTKTVEALLTETDLSEALTKMGQNQLPPAAVAAQ